MNSQAHSLADQALRIINPRIKLEPMFVVEDTAAMMEASELLGQAVVADPGDPVVHYAYASALQLALQSGNAESELVKLAARHPGWHLAKFACEAGSGKGLPGALNLFALPEWSSESPQLPPVYAGKLGMAIYAVRRGIVPAAVYFERDTDHWWSRSKLSGVRIDVALAQFARHPNAAAVYRWCEGPGLSEPDIQENIVILDLPKDFGPLIGWQYLTCQDHLEVVIADSQGSVLHATSVSLSGEARNVLQNIAQTLTTLQGRSQSTDEWMRVVRNVQNSTDLDEVERRYFRR